MANLNQTDDKVETPNRRISWFAWLATAIVAFGLLAMNARGIPDPDSFYEILPESGPSLVTNCSYNHGWPMSWLESQPPDVPEGIRLNEGSGDWRTKPDRGDSWLFLVEAKSIHWGALLINLVLAMLILTIVYILCKRRWRHGFRFNLLEIGIGVVLVSFAFANYQHHKDISRKEIETTQAYSLSNPAWSGPVWLRRLIGEPHWLGEYRHFETISISTSSIDAETVNAISKLPYLRELSIKGDPSRGQIELLGKLVQLEVVEVEYVLF